MYIANCPFNKIKILCVAMIGLEKSSRMMYCNLCINSRETAPLRWTCRMNKNFEINQDYHLEENTKSRKSRETIPWIQRIWQAMKRWLNGLEVSARGWWCRFNSLIGLPLVFDGKEGGWCGGGGGNFKLQWTLCVCWELLYTVVSWEFVVVEVL